MVSGENLNKIAAGSSRWWWMVKRGEMRSKKDPEDQTMSPIHNIYDDTIQDQKTNRQPQAKPF